MTIAAIETKYKGVPFKSRTEARWALFLDLIGIRWEYEHEKYEFLSGDRYKPDFWLLKHRTYLEIKGQRPTSREILRCEHLSEEARCTVLIAWGAPKRWNMIHSEDEEHQGMMAFGLYESPLGTFPCWKEGFGWVYDINGDPCIYSQKLDYDGVFTLRADDKISHNQLIRNKQHFGRLIPNSIFQKAKGADFESLNRSDKTPGLFD
jgi:hypothetical protein